MIGEVGEGAGSPRSLGLLGDQEIGMRLVNTFLAALSRGFANPKELEEPLERQDYSQL
jgi:hypothetical protein